MKAIRPTPASPRARPAMRQGGIDPAAIRGTGPNGCIMEADVLQAAAISPLPLWNADYRDIFGVTDLRAVRELRSLVGQVCVLLEGHGRGARYGRGPAPGAEGPK